MWKLPSPADVEVAYTAFENRCIEALVRNRFFFPPALGTVVVVWLWLGIGEWLDSTSAYNFRSTVTTMAFHHHALLLLPVLALIGFLFQGQLLRVYFALCVVGLWIFESLYPRNYSTWQDSMRIGAAGIVLFLAAHFYVYFVRRFRSRGTVILILFSALVFGGLAASLPFRLFNVVWRLNLTSLVLFALATVYRGVPDKERPWLGLNPVHGFRGILWPHGVVMHSERDLARLRLWWKGALNVSLAACLLYIRRPIHDAFYWKFVLGDIAYFNFIAGSARMFGYAVPDATRFAVLARTPADYWQRGSVYNYAFINEFVYFPLMRRLRRPALAVSVAFFFFFFSHFELGRLTRPASLLVVFFVFFAWLAAILMSRRLWPLPYKPGEAAWRAWLSIGLTHLIYFTISISSALVWRLLVRVV
jgi:hypothetical protein